MDGEGAEEGKEEEEYEEEVEGHGDDDIDDDDKEVSQQKKKPGGPRIFAPFIFSLLKVVNGRGFQTVRLTPSQLEHSQLMFPQASKPGMVIVQASVFTQFIDNFSLNVVKLERWINNDLLCPIWTARRHLFQLEAFTSPLVTSQPLHSKGLCSWLDTSQIFSEVTNRTAYGPRALTITQQWQRLPLLLQPPMWCWLLRVRFHVSALASATCWQSTHSAGTRSTDWKVFFSTSF